MVQRKDKNGNINDYLLKGDIFKPLFIETADQINSMRSSAAHGVNEFGMILFNKDVTITIGSGSTAITIPRFCIGFYVSTETLFMFIVQNATCFIEAFGNANGWQRGVVRK